MATYSDPDNLRGHFYKVEADEVFSRILRRACLMAYNFINSYLSGIYTVPFSTSSPPGEIKDISDLVAKYVAQALQLKQPIILEEERTANDMKMALVWLKDIIRGKADIVGQTRLTTRGAYHNMEGFEPIFHVDDSLVHYPDTDLLDAIGEDRD